MSEQEQNNISEQADTKEATCACGCQKKACRCRKAGKIALWIAGIIIVIAAILLLFRDMYIPFVVSKAGTFALGTKVELKKFSSSLTGKVDIQGLSVANPEGYNNPNAFKLEHVYVDVSVLSLLSNEIVVREILVTGMQVDLEAKLNRTNLGELKANVDRLVPQKSSADAESDTADTKEKSAKSVVIEKLNINNNFISLSNSMISMTSRIPLVPISMENVGKGQSVAETFNEIFIKILTSVFDACAGVGGALGDSVKNAGSALSDSASSIGKGLVDASGKIFKGFK